jgi:hypothetical protein
MDPTREVNHKVSKEEMAEVRWESKSEEVP